MIQDPNQHNQRYKDNSCNPKKLEIQNSQHPKLSAIKCQEIPKLQNLHCSWTSHMTKASQSTKSHFYYTKSQTNTNMWHFTDMRHSFRWKLVPLYWVYTGHNVLFWNLKTEHGFNLRIYFIWEYSKLCNRYRQKVKNRKLIQVQKSSQRRTFTFSLQ